MKKTDFDKETKIDLLKFFYQYQLNEIGYRREREYRIFTWTSSLLLALIAGLLVYRKESIVILGFYGIAGKVIISSAIFLLTLFSVSWQSRNANYRMENWKIISHISHLLHSFDNGFFDLENKTTLFPKSWENYGKERKIFFARLWEVNYSTATILLGILAISMVWATR